MRRNRLAQMRPNLHVRKCRLVHPFFYYQLQGNSATSESNQIPAISPSVNLASGADWFHLLPGDISCTYEFRASAHLKSQNMDKTLTLSARMTKGNLYILGQFVRYSSSDITLARSSEVAPVNTIEVAGGSKHPISPDQVKNVPCRI